MAVVSFDYLEALLRRKFTLADLRDMVTRHMETFVDLYIISANLITLSCRRGHPYQSQDLLPSTVQYLYSTVLGTYLDIMAASRHYHNGSLPVQERRRAGAGA